MELKDIISDFPLSHIAKRHYPLIRQEEFGGVLYWPFLNTQFHLLNKIGFDVIKRLIDRDFKFELPVEIALIRKLASKSLSPKGFKHTGNIPSSKWYSGRFKSPLYVLLEITSLCSFHCDYCFNMKNMSDIKHLEAEKIFSILDEFKNMEIFHVVLSGGDPIEHPNINQILSYLKNYNITSTVITKSGYSKIIKKLSILPDNFIFSLDSMNGNRFDSVVEKNGAHKNLMKAVTEFSKKQSSVMISAAIEKHEMNKIEELFDFSVNNKVDKIRIRPILDCNSKQRLNASVKESWSIGDLELIRDSINKYSNNILIDISPFLAIFNADNIFPYCLDCKAEKFYAKIMSSGNVVPCSVLDDTVIDNVLVKSFGSIWNNELDWKEFRNDRMPVCYLRQRFPASGCSDRSDMGNLSTK
jgi:MoaA/NifB/PqqE/SkfB family radical SAM enzyme